MLQKIKSTEKLVKMLEVDNILSFETDRRCTKADIRAEVEKLFGVKVQSVNTHQRKNKKISYVRLKKGYSAMDVATRAGVI